MRPTPEERDEINRIIMGELVCGVLIRPISEDIAATPHRLDVIASASCPREFIAQRADLDIDDFLPRLAPTGINAIEEHLLRHDRALA